MDAVRRSARGCTCPDGPFYYVVVRAGQHAHKEAVGRDRHQAEIALRGVAAAVDDGSFRTRPTIGFLEWADRWLASLERKPTTVGSYRSTIAHAKDVFGSQRVRRIAPEDIARFNASSGVVPICGFESGAGASIGPKASSGVEGGRVLRTTNFLDYSNTSGVSRFERFSSWR